MSDRELLIVAGEASGDLHGARLLSELRHLVGDVRAFGLGGDELEAAGFDALAHSSEIAVVGITEVVKILPRARQIFRQLLEAVERRKPRAAILIDSPDFNMRLARKLARRGVEVIYYISPQLWAWRRGRVKAVERDVDLMMVLFPFEAGFYAEHGVKAAHVGHPLVDEIPRLDHRWDAEPHGPVGDLVVALMPGSRRSEVRALLPPMLGAVRAMRAVRGVHARLIQAPTVPPELFDELLEESGVEVERVRSHRHRAVADCHLALVASGTATLEVALLGTPMVVLYRLNPMTYWLASRLVDLPHFCMVNLVLEERVVPELLQDETEPANVAREALSLAADDDRIRAMRARLADLRGALGSSGASGRAAAAVAEHLGWGASA
ncbi:MAG: lipid-A-disaccharide synthase [Acidobacteriota bacterium]